MDSRMFAYYKPTFHVNFNLIIYSFNSMCGYSNPISFKDIGDSDITFVENFIKKDAFDFVTKSLNESLIENKSDYQCDVLISDEQKIEIFGRTYAQRSELFQFMPGDISLIRNLAARVKELVDGNGNLSGLELFEPPKKKRKATIHSVLSVAAKKKCMPKTNHKLVTTRLNDDEIAILQSNLYEKVENCLKLHSIDTTKLSPNLIEISECGKYATIVCILCPDERHQNPLSVYYAQPEHRSNYWVLANFTKHLRTQHNAISNPAKANETKTKEKKKKNKSLCDLLTKSEEETNTSDVSIKFLGEVPNDELSPEFNVSTWLYNQISDQITKMVGSVLVNGDEQEKMNFQLSKQPEIRSLSIVTTRGDGNCLYSALAHQLFGNAINSQAHANETKKLRSAVVDHILLPENFLFFEFALQERVKEIKNEDSITDYTTECKLYVRHVLSRSGKFGGLESIKAVSDMHKVNVLVFDENDSCYIIRGSAKNYNRTILIAYRSTINAAGEKNRMHYDSISDIDSKSIFASVDTIINKWK